MLKQAYFLDRGIVPMEEVLALLTSCWQQSEKLMCKRDVLASGAWLVSLDN